MRLKSLLPAGLMLALLAGCSGTTTASADEQSVGFDASAKSCCHKDGGKAACSAEMSKECAEKAAACDKGGKTTP